MRRTSLRTRLGRSAFVAALACTPLHAREMLAAKDGWAAFRDAPGRCRAVTGAAAWSRDGAARPHLDILVMPGRARNQVHFGLSHPATAAALLVGGRSFALTVRQGDAWAADAVGDDAVLALVRLGGVLRVEGRTATGSRFRDIYRLAGAPTAIDAARLGCRH